MNSVQAAAAVLPGRPGVGIVLGSGWAAVADALGETVWSAPMAELPGFAAPTALGHGGTVRLVARAGHRDPVLVYLGRLHLYEGHPPETVVHPVRVAIAAGCRTLVLTNAAGGIDPGVPVGTPVLIADQLNLTGRGIPYGAARRGPVYPARLRELARQVDPALTDAVYAGLGGPHFETPAEIRMLRAVGAGLVGMSTVLEAAAAHASGAAVLGISLVSNLAAGVSAHPLSAEEVMAAGNAAQPQLAALLAGVLDRLANR